MRNSKKAVPRHDRVRDARCYSMTIVIILFYFYFSSGSHLLPHVSCLRKIKLFKAEACFLSL